MTKITHNSLYVQYGTLIFNPFFFTIKCDCFYVNITVNWAKQVIFLSPSKDSLWCRTEMIL